MSIAGAPEIQLAFIAGGVKHQSGKGKTVANHGRQAAHVTSF
jgi:hypothetical protein